MFNKFTHLSPVSKEDIERVQQLYKEGASLQKVEETLSKLIDGEICIYLVEGEKLYRHADTAKEPLIASKGLVASSIQSKKSFVENYALTHKEYFQPVDNPEDRRIKALVSVPIHHAGTVVLVVVGHLTPDSKKRLTRKDIDIIKCFKAALLNFIKEKTQVDLGALPKNKKEIVRVLEESKTTPKKTIKNVEEVCSQCEREKDSITGYMAGLVHDMRTPINAISGFLELLESELNDVNKEYIRNAVESVEFANELVTQVLDYAKAQKSAVELNCVSANPLEEFQNITQFFVANMKKKDVAFNIFLSNRMPQKASLDYYKIKRVLINLIGNAYKFTPESGHIDIDITFSDGAFHFSVQDSGIGIKKERQESIFEAFEQADETTAQEYGGHGLGLSICNSFVKTMGSTLELQSEIGEGSRFFFSVPLQESNPALFYTTKENYTQNVVIFCHEKALSSAHCLQKYIHEFGFSNTQIVHDKESLELEKIEYIFAYRDILDSIIINQILKQKIKFTLVKNELFKSYKRENSPFEEITVGTYFSAQIHFALLGKMLYAKEKIEAHNARVMIIDDSELNLRLVEKIIDKVTPNVYGFANGKRAVEFMEEQIKESLHPHVIFVDENMPQMSGLEVVKWVRNFEQTHELDPINIVSISGNDSEDFRNTFRELGVELFVSKPFEVKEILKAYNSFF